MSNWVLPALLAALLVAVLVAVLVGRDRCLTGEWSARVAAYDSGYTAQIYQGCTRRGAVRAATETEVRDRAAEEVDRIRRLDASGGVIHY